MEFPVPRLARRVCVDEDLELPILLVHSPVLMLGQNPRAWCITSLEGATNPVEAFLSLSTSPWLPSVMLSCFDVITVLPSKGCFLLCVFAMSKPADISELF